MSFLFWSTPIRNTSVAGISFCQDVVKEMRKNNRVELVLRREPHNEHDRNAIAILDGKTMKKVGYLPATEAMVLSPLMNRGWRYQAVVTNYVGGGEGMSHGIRMRLILRAIPECDMPVIRDKAKQLVAFVENNKMEG